MSRLHDYKTGKFKEEPKKSETLEDEIAKFEEKMMGKKLP